MTEANNNRRDLAPIALFIYRRSDLLGAVLDSLEACPEFSHSQLYIFSDGPKNASEAEAVRHSRALVRARLRPNMKLIESEVNMGLSLSIIKGVTQLCNEAGRVIVIEDDLVVSPAILSWFNLALDRFARVGRVFQISGHVSGRPGAPGDAGMFAPLTTSWGWATWQRAWQRFDPEAYGWEQLRHDANMRRSFDLDGSVHFSRMLDRQMAGEIDSWAIRWYWTVFKENGLVLFPPTALVKNCGQDSFATHGGIINRVRARFKRSTQVITDILPSLPETVEESPQLLREVKRASRKIAFL